MAGVVCRYEGNGDAQLLAWQPVAVCPLLDLVVVTCCASGICTRTCTRGSTQFKLTQAPGEPLRWARAGLSFRPTEIYDSGPQYCRSLLVNRSFQVEW